MQDQTASTNPDSDLPLRPNQVAERASRYPARVLPQKATCRWALHQLGQLYWLWEEKKYPGLDAQY